MKKLRLREAQILNDGPEIWKQAHNSNIHVYILLSVVDRF